MTPAQADLLDSVNDDFQAFLALAREGITATANDAEHAARRLAQTADAVDAVRFWHIFGRSGRLVRKPIFVLFPLGRTIPRAWPDCDFCAKSRFDADSVGKRFFVSASQPHFNLKGLPHATDQP